MKESTMVPETVMRDFEFSGIIVVQSRLHSGALS